MSNLDQPDVVLAKDYARVRLDPVGSWLAFVLPLVLAGAGDYLIARKCGSHPRRRALVSALVLGAATLLTLISLTPFVVIPLLTVLDVLVITVIKCLLARFLFGIPLRWATAFSYLGTSFAFCALFLAYVLLNSFRL